MKLFPSLLLAGSIVFAPSLFAAGESVQQVLEDGQRAMLRGDYAAAKRSFQIVAQVDPKNTVAASNLRIIQLKEAQEPKGNDTEKQLATVILPKIDFHDASLGSVFEYFRQQVPKISGGRLNLNLVLQLPETQLNSTVTLQLTNVPITVALQYLADLSSLQIEYQKYAVKVSARGAGPATTAAPAPGSDTPSNPAVPGLR